LRVRGMVEETATFFSAMKIMLRVEDHLGITITDELAKETCEEHELTLANLATLAMRASPSVSPALADDAIRSAVRIEFPGAPESPDFAAPLLEAIGKTPQFGVVSS